MPPEAHTGRSTDKQEERTEEDAESVFSDSEEEEGEVIGGRRDVASDAEDEGEAIQVSNHEVAAGTSPILIAQSLRPQERWSLSLQH